MLSFLKVNSELSLPDLWSQASFAGVPLGALINQNRPHVPKCVSVAIFGAWKAGEKSMRYKTLVFTMQNELISFANCWTSHASSLITCQWDKCGVGKATLSIAASCFFILRKYSFCLDEMPIQRGNGWPFYFNEILIQNGRHQKWAFGVDETLICNLHLGSAGRLRPLCRASQNGKLKVVRDFCESVVVFEGEFRIKSSGPMVPGQLCWGTSWSFN